MIKSLQSLRGIFAIVIICYHYYSRSQVMVDATSCSVAFFFIMSGFALGLHHRVTSIRGFNFWQYMRNRFAKLYPLHVLLTLAMVYFVGVNWRLWANLLLVQNWFTNEDTWFSYNGTSWFVSSLAFCYLFYSFISYYSWKLKPLARYLIIAAAIAFVACLYWITPPAVHQWIYYIAAPTRLIDFGLGIVLARTYNDCQSRINDISHASATTVTVAAIILVAAVIGWHHSTDLSKAYWLSTVWYVPLGFLILTMSIAEAKKSIVTRLLSWQPLVWLGSISFEMYLLQALVNNIVLKLENMFIGTKGSPELHIISILVVIIPLAWITQRYFTTPVARWLKR